MLQAREADDEGQNLAILNSTRGIIFLATPHRGSGYGNLSFLGAAVSWLWSGMNMRLLKTLRYESESLRRINNGFLNTLRSRSTRGEAIRICSFAEELSQVPFFSVGFSATFSYAWRNVAPARTDLPTDRTSHSLSYAHHPPSWDCPARLRRRSGQTTEISVDLPAKPIRGIRGWRDG